MLNPSMAFIFVQIGFFNTETGYFRIFYSFLQFYPKKYYFLLKVVRNQNFTNNFHKSEIVKLKSVILQNLRVLSTSIKKKTKKLLLAFSMENGTLYYH